MGDSCLRVRSPALTQLPLALAHDAGKYMVWTMSDLAGTTVTMLLFADAYDGHKLVRVGRQPTVPVYHGSSHYT